MKKVLLMTCLCASTFAACAQQKLQISGTVPESMNGKYVYLYESRGAKLDSALVNKGKVKMTIAANQNKFANVSFQNGEYRTAFPVYLDNKAITFNVTDEAITYKGSDVTNLLYKNEEAMDQMRGVMMKLNAEYKELSQKGEVSKEDMKSLNKRAGEAQDTYFTNVKELIKNNTNNIAAGYLLANIADNMEADELQEIMNLKGAFTETEQYKQVAKQLESMKKSLPGATFTHFEMEDVNGAKHSTKEFVGNGKYVLVDFWASWCGPCRAEMPNVKKAYEAYKDKGFDVLGISLDSKKEAWTKAIDQLGLTWNHLSDLKGWQCEAAAMYGVRGIPFMLLVGPDGKIIAQNLRGEALQEKLAEVLK